MCGRRRHSSRDHLQQSAFFTREEFSRFLELLVADLLYQPMSLKDRAPVEECHQEANHVSDERADHLHNVNDRVDRLLDRGYNLLHDLIGVFDN